MIAAGIAGATVAFNHALALPVAEPFLASLAALASTIGFRFVVADKDRRLLQKSFALYLAPHVINRMLTSNKLPELGGETRNVTVFFSDIEGFSLIAEKMSPDSLMELMNEYLSAMTDIIEGHGGYVDKYIGDSIVAVFGAPADDPRSCRQCGARRAGLLREACANSTAPRPRSSERKLAQRIGINSGEALVGNFGSRRRFNYSVMSDAVNLASRLEGANKFYGTTIIASETTVALAGDGFRLARTRRGPGQGPKPGAENLRTARARERAYDCASGARSPITPMDWRTGARANSSSPRRVSQRVAGIDRPASLFCQRARELAQNPPGEDWDPIRTLQEK